MLGVWRHGVKRFPLTYDHGYWGAVFPLGMYSVCTFRLARQFDLPFLTPLGEIFAWVSLAAWAATAVGLARRMASHESPGSKPASSMPSGALTKKVARGEPSATGDGDLGGR
jgi:tellurite resistance protein TehA-like permease